MRRSKSQINRTFSYCYSIVVCTKNRPGEISKFLQHLTTQHSIYLKSVIVVDGSTESASQGQVVNQDNLSLLYPQVIFLGTTGGKPTALNLSMKFLSESKTPIDAVAFIDDDISFHLDDLETGIRFLKNNNLCGLSPIIVNEGDTCNRKRYRNHEGIFSYRKSGVLTKSGDNRGFNYRNIKGNWRKSEWLPGGAVIYDWPKIHTLSFNQQLENSALNGYALGDDIDFSIKARNAGDLGCLQEIQVIHSSPLTSYRNPNLMAMARGKWKAFLTSQYPEVFSRHRVLLVEILRAIWHGVLRGKPKASYSCLNIFLREFAKESKRERSARTKAKNK